jgi:hypothetical protein
MNFKPALSKRFVLLAAIGTAAPALVSAPAAAQAPSGNVSNVSPGFSATWHDNFGVRLRFPEWGITVRVGDPGDKHDRRARHGHAPCARDVCAVCRPSKHRPHHPHFGYERRLHHAWDAIAGGDYRDAKQAFIRLIKADPDDPRPRIGVSLAQGLRGYDGKSIRAMRRAVALRPRALEAVPCSGPLKVRVDRLLRTLENRVWRKRNNADDLFMIAALRTIGGDARGAWVAVCDAIAHGDRSPAAAKLRDHLRRRAPAHRPGRGGYGPRKGRARDRHHG